VELEGHSCSLRRTIPIPRRSRNPLPHRVRGIAKVLRRDFGQLRFTARPRCGCLIIAKELENLSRTEELASDRGCLGFLGQIRSIARAKCPRSFREQLSLEPPSP
jgi:hypothetical protein